MSALLDALPAAARSALAAHVARLKHDLGKYVALRQRWLGEDAALDEQLDALRDDVLCTRRGPDGTVDALSVWGEFRPGLLGEADLPGGHRVDLAADPELREIDEAMTHLAEVVAALQANEGGEALVRRGRRAALAVSDGCRALDRRVRASLGPGGS